MAGKPKSGGSAFKLPVAKKKMPKPKASANKRLMGMMKKASKKNPFPT